MVGSARPLGVDSCGVFLPVVALDGLLATALRQSTFADAEATPGDLRAQCRYDIQAGRFRRRCVPVLLQVGTESPRHLYVTDALVGVLPNLCVEELPGGAHKGMTTAPEMYAETVSPFLRS